MVKATLKNFNNSCNSLIQFYVLNVQVRNTHAMLELYSPPKT